MKCTTNQTIAILLLLFIFMQPLSAFAEVNPYERESLVENIIKDYELFIESFIDPNERHSMVNIIQKSDDLGQWLTLMWGGSATSSISGTIESNSEKLDKLIEMVLTEEQYEQLKDVYVKYSKISPEIKAYINKYEYFMDHYELSDDLKMRELELETIAEERVEVRELFENIKKYEENFAKLLDTTDTLLSMDTTISSIEYLNKLTSEKGKIDEKKASEQFDVVQKNYSDTLEKAAKDYIDNKNKVSSDVYILVLKLLETIEYKWETTSTNDSKVINEFYNKFEIKDEKIKNLINSSLNQNSLGIIEKVIKSSNEEVIIIPNSLRSEAYPLLSKMTTTVIFVPTYEDLATYNNKLNTLKKEDEFKNYFLENPIFEVLGQLNHYEIINVKTPTVLKLRIGDTSSEVNGVYNEIEGAPYIKNSTTLVPVRYISQTFECSVDWKPKQRKVLVENDNTTIELILGNNEAKVNGKVITLDTATEISNSRTMVPLRFISEALGKSVEWNGENKEICIKDKF